MKFFIQRDKVQAAVMNLDHLGGGHYEISWCHVDPHYRGKGLASGLLWQAIKWANANGFVLIGFVHPNQTGLSPDAIEEWLQRFNFKSVRYTFRDGNTKSVMMKDPHTANAIPIVAPFDDSYDPLDPFDD
jgi:GNAT superfamily N-acetyltransferase